MHINSRDASVEYGSEYIRIRLTNKPSAASQARQIIDEIANQIHPTDVGFAREVVRVWNEFGEGQQVLTYVGTRISLDRM